MTVNILLRNQLTAKDTRDFHKGSREKPV